MLRGYRAANQLSAVSHGTGGLTLSPTERTASSGGRGGGPFATFPTFPLDGLLVFAVMEPSVAVSNVRGPRPQGVVFGIAPLAGRGPVSSQLCSLHDIQGSEGHYADFPPARRPCYVRLNIAGIRRWDVETGRVWRAQFLGNVGAVPEQRQRSLTCGGVDAAETFLASSRLMLLASRGSRSYRSPEPRSEKAAGFPC